MKTLCIALTALFLLVSCGKTPPTGEAPLPQSSSAVLEDETDLRQEKLVYWSMWQSQEPQADVLAEAYENFAATRYELPLEIRWIGRDNYNKVLTALKSGEQIDIFDGDVQRINTMFSGKILKLDDYYAKDVEGMVYGDIVMPQITDLSRLYSPDGSIYTVAYQPYLFAFIYDKQAFESAGVDSPPETWGQFAEACEKIKATGRAAITADYETISLLFGYHLARLKGDDFVSELALDPFGMKWNEPEVLKAAQDFESFAIAGYFSGNIGTNAEPDAMNDLITGNAAMYLSSTFLVGDIIKTVGESYPVGIMNYPEINGGVSALNAASVGAQAFAINKDCENPDAAFDLIADFTSGWADLEISRRANTIPVGKQTPWPEPLTDAEAVFARLDTYYPWAAGLERNPAKVKVIRAALQELCGGKLSAVEFIEKCKMY